MIDSLSSWYLEQLKIVSTSLVSLCTEHPRPRRCGQFHSCSYRKVRRKLPILPSDQVVHLYRVYICCKNSLKASCVIIFKYPKIHFTQMIFIFSYVTEWVYHNPSPMCTVSVHVWRRVSFYPSVSRHPVSYPWTADTAGPKLTGHQLYSGCKHLKYQI